MRKKVFAAVVMALLVICQSAFAALPENIVSGPLDSDLYDPNYNWWEDEVLLESASEYTQKANPAYNDPFLKYQWDKDAMNVDVLWKAMADGKVQAHNPSHVFLIVIDTGVDLHHEDIDVSGVPYTNGLLDRYGVYGIGQDKEEKNGYIQDITMDSTVWTIPEGVIGPGTYHGTSVAGVAVSPANGTGITGTAPGITVIPVNYQMPWLDDEYPSMGDDDMQTALLNYVSDEVIPWLKNNFEDARIMVNLSYRVMYPAYRADDVSPIVKAYDKLFAIPDVLFIIAAGSDSTSMEKYIEAETEGYFSDHIVFPYNKCDVNSSNVITVASHAYGDKWAPFSNYSTAMVDICAPGESILSLGTGDDTDELSLQAVSYRFVSGTSFAAPNTAGVAALLWQIFPDATAAEIKKMIVEGAKTTQDIPSYDYYGKEDPTVITDKVAYGYLDAAAALNASSSVLGADRGISVEVPLKSIKIETERNAVYYVGDKFTAEVTNVTPVSMKDTPVTWMTSDLEALSVDQETGEFTALSIPEERKVNIWAEATRGGYTVKSNEIAITVPKAPEIPDTPDVPGSEIILPTAITVLQSDGVRLADGMTVPNNTNFTLIATMAPDNVTDQMVGWSISDESVLKFVDATGMTATFKALKPGSTNIEVSHVSGELSVKFTVYVDTEHVKPASIVFDNLSESVMIDGTVTLNPTVLPEGANYTLTYASSNSEVATVTYDGVVTGIAEGTAKITVATDNGLTAECTIKVTATEPEPDPEPTPDPEPEPDPTPDPDPNPDPETPETSGGGGGGGCNAGAGALALLAIAPLYIRNRRK